MYVYFMDFGQFPTFNVLKVAFLYLMRSHMDES